MSAGEGVWKAVEVRRFFSFQSAAVESAERLASGDGVLENGTPLVKELEGGKPLCIMMLASEVVSSLALSTCWTSNGVLLSSNDLLALVQAKLWFL